MFTNCQKCGSYFKGEEDVKVHHYIEAGTFTHLGLNRVEYFPMTNKKFVCLECFKKINKE